MARKKILITGALGYIGSSLIKNLDKNVAEIILIDNSKNQNYFSLSHLPKRFKFIKADTKSNGFEKYLKGVDIVIHLAATPYKNDDNTSQKEVTKNNYLSLKRVADACLAKKVKLIFPSTTSVYGSSLPKVDENTLELIPQSPHAQEKLTCEKYLQGLGKKGLKYTICRFATVYGPSRGMRFDTAVNRFLLQAITNEPITVWKTALNQKRPYLDIDDCHRALNLIIKKDLFQNEVFNVATENLTVKQVLGVIKKFIPELKISYINSDIMNTLSYELDCQKIISRGFKPRGNIEKGIEKTIVQLCKLN